MRTLEFKNVEELAPIVKTNSSVGTRVGTCTIKEAQTCFIQTGMQYTMDLKMPNPIAGSLVDILQLAAIPPKRPPRPQRKQQQTVHHWTDKEQISLHIFGYIAIRASPKFNEHSSRQKRRLQLG
ncbi:hypothetical protein V2G26_007771 [Clonostachys chloroleuca]